MKTYGGMDVFLTSALVEDEWRVSRPGHFTPIYTLILPIQLHGLPGERERSEVSVFQTSKLEV
jgi:hypothetical protein